MQKQHADVRAHSMIAWPPQPRRGLAHHPSRCV